MKYSILGIALLIYATSAFTSKDNDQKPPFRVIVYNDSKELAPEKYTCFWRKETLVVRYMGGDFSFSPKKEGNLDVNSIVLVTDSQDRLSLAGTQYSHSK